MPKPTNTQELTARYLAAGAGFKPEEQFFALLNAASHVHANYWDKKPDSASTDSEWLEQWNKPQVQLEYAMDSDSILEPLADDKAPF